MTNNNKIHHSEKNIELKKLYKQGAYDESSINHDVQQGTITEFDTMIGSDL